MNETKSELMEAGWKITSDGPSGTQLEEPKRMNKREGFSILVGIVLIPFFGIGLLVIGAAIIDHFMRKPNVRFFVR